MKNPRRSISSCGEFRAAFCAADRLLGAILDDKRCTRGRENDFFFLVDERERERDGRF